MTFDALLDAYIDLNLLLVAGTLLWLATRKLLSRTSLAYAYLPQLRLLNILTALLTLSPLLALALTTFVVAHPPNISDLLVAQYLQGNVNMSATSFETLLGVREDVIRAMSGQQPLWTRIVMGAFTLGALLCGLHVVLSILRLQRALKDAFLWKRLGTVHLMISDTARVAYSTRGPINRYVVLPTKLLSNPKDLKLTVAHELQHFRQRDIECEFLLETLRPFLFWNPAFFLWRREIRLLREFACDQALMARASFDMRAYCECLIRACAQAAQGPVLFTRRSPAVALVDRRETRSALERRIVAVTAQQAPQGMMLSWSFVSLAMVTAVLSTAILIQRPGDWSHDRLMLSTIVNLERMASRQANDLRLQASSEMAALQGGFMPSALAGRPQP